MPKTQFYRPSIATALILAAMHSPSCLAHGGGGGGGGGHGGGAHFGGGGGFHSSSMGHYSSPHSFYGGVGHPGMYGHSGFYGTRPFGTYHTYHGWNQLNKHYGYWSSWSNPSLMYIWGWGNQGLPLYASGPGFNDLSVSPTSIPDQEGNVYTAAIYRFDPEYVSNFTWTDATRVSEQSAIHDEPARYRLGPDTDIISGGKVVIRVGSLAYMMIAPEGTQLISVETGLPIVSLSTDPSLLWHLSAELSRQSQGLESAIKLQSQKGQTAANHPDDPDTSGVSKQTAQAIQSVRTAQPDQPAKSLDLDQSVESVQLDAAGVDRKLKNLQSTADLLKAAQTGLGNAAAVPPDPAPPPVADADELFSGTWVTRDAKFVLLKRPDGSVVYTDGNAWFSDLGKTTIPGPSVEQFKRVVLSYISNLVADAPKAQEYLKQFRKQSEVSVHSLNDTLKKLQSQEKQAGDGQQNEYAEAIGRLDADLSVANARLQNLDQMHEELPKELATANLILKKWQ
jgi:hypothetical protein